MPASVFGGINVPAAPAVFILFPVPRLVLHVFCVRESGLGSLLLVKGRERAASPLSSVHGAAEQARLEALIYFLLSDVFKKRKDPSHQAALLEACMAVDWGDWCFQNAVYSHQARVTLELCLDKTFPTC